jgi:hypothetical protein
VERSDVTGDCLAKADSTAYRWAGLDCCAAARHDDEGLLRRPGEFMTSAWAADSEGDAFVIETGNNRMNKDQAPNASDT